MENKKLPTANTLFRFLHLRPPGDEPQDAKTENRYIDNRVKSASLFLAAVEDLDGQEEIDTALQTVVESFVPMKDAKAVSAVNPNLMKFGEWVGAPKTNVFANELGDRLEGVNILTDEELATVWDNLYYLAITSGSESTRDALITLLRGNHFIEVLTAYMAEHPEGDDPEKDGPTEEEQVMGQNLKHASVLIPSVLVSRAHKEEVETLVDAMDPYEKKALVMLQEADLARFNIGRYKTVIDEIRKAQLFFDKEISLERRVAIEAYNASIETLVETAPVNKETREPIIPELPLFVFEPVLVFDESYLTDKVSEATLKLYLGAKKPVHKDTEDVLAEFESDITREYERLLDNTPQNVIIKAYNGITLNVNNKPQDDSLVINAIRLYENEEVYALFATHYFSNPDVRLRQLDITVATGDETSAHFVAKRASYESDTHASYLLFPQGLNVNLATGTHTVTYTRTAVNPLYSWAKPSAPMSFPQYDASRTSSNPYDGQIGNDRVRPHGVTQLKVGEFNRVEQEIYCYVAGEVSNIENIMAREYREKSSRNLTRSETSTEETIEREVENLNDTTTTDRYEMQQEVSQVLQQDQSLQIGSSVGVSVDAKPYSVNMNTNLNFSTSSSETNSFNQAESYAQEVTERAMQRIVEKTTYKRTSRMLREYEENNKHGFDNRLGDKHVTGIYRWVDKVYKNTLVNYGKRLMYDFMVPEPSKTFKHWMTKKEGAAPVAILKEPKLLPELAGGYWGVDLYNYGRLAAEYGADVDTPPDYVLRIGKSFSESPATTGKEVKDRISTGHNFKLEIPEGYQCVNVRWSYSQYQVGNKVDLSNVTVNISGEQAISGFANARFNNYIPDSGGLVVDRVEKELEISVSTLQVGGFGLNILAVCQLKDLAYDAWRNRTYMAIMEAYNKKLQAYQDAKAAEVAPADPNAKIDYNFNPLIGRSIEQRELKRLCIEMMARPYGIYIGQNHYQPQASNNYKVKQTPALDRYAEQVRFFEEAFDWEIMSYMFYPYYWGEEGLWEKLIKEQSTADFIFQAFLQSGMGKVTLPVRIGYERAVLYYFDTGKVWFGKGYTLDGGKLLYRHILSGLRVKEPNEDGYVMSEWLTRVPSALTIIQSDSAPLDENGLPCFCCEDGTPVLADPCSIAKGNSLMQGMNDSGTGSGTSAKMYMEFPADTTLTVSDIGKLVANVAGKAKVALAEPGEPAKTGIWEFFPGMVNKPLQAEYELGFTDQPAVGQTFTVNGTEFSFVDSTPTDVTQILIGADLTETVQNTATVLNDYNIHFFLEVAVVDYSITVTVGDDYIGIAGNSLSFTQSVPVPDGVSLSWALKSEGANKDFDLIDISLMDFGGFTLTLGEALSVSAPNGPVFGDYKWPNSAYQFAENIQWALYEKAAFEDRFQCVIVDSDTFRIQEIGLPPNSAHITFHPYITNANQVQSSHPAGPDVVKEVVLGVLEKLSGGIAYIGAENALKVKLAPGASVEFSATWPSKIDNRALLAGNSGLAIRIQDDMDLSNGMYLALQEGEPGDEIWAEKAFLSSF